MRTCVFRVFKRVLDCCVRVLWSDEWARSIHPNQPTTTSNTPTPKTGYENSLPSTAQVAFQQSEIAAWNVWSSLRASAPGPLQFRYTPLGEMLTLGPMEGAVSGIRGLFQLEGPPASLARRLVYVMRMPTGGQRLRAAKGWVQGRAERLKGQLRGVLQEGAGGGGGGGV